MWHKSCTSCGNIKVEIPEYLKEFELWTTENVADTKFNLEFINFNSHPDYIKYISDQNEMISVNAKYQRLTFMIAGKHDIKLILSNDAGGEIEISEQYDSVIVTKKYGIYKRDGFDEAFKALHKLKPLLTEIEFAKFIDPQKIIDPYYYKQYCDCCNCSSCKYAAISTPELEWDDDLVEIREFTGDESCFESYEKSHSEQIFKNIFNTHISITVSELPENIDVIKFLLLNPTGLSIKSANYSIV